MMKFLKYDTGIWAGTTAMNALLRTVGALYNDADEWSYESEVKAGARIIAEAIVWLTQDERFYGAIVRFTDEHHAPEVYSLPRPQDVDPDDDGELGMSRR